jgi:hypothetical protein
MRNAIRTLRNIIPYLLTASLFTIIGVLLIGLMYYPLPSASTVSESQITTVTDQEYEQAHDLLAAMMLADAIRQLQAERQTQTRNPNRNSAPSGELPAGLRVAPLIIENGNDLSRPVLIRL